MISESIFHYFLSAIFICFFTLLGALVAFWITKKHGIIDVFWGIGIPMAIITTTKFNFGDLHWAIYMMVGLWGLRLSCFILFTRILTQHTDRRYTHMRQSSPTGLMVKQILIQTPLQVLLVFTTYPLILSSSINPVCLALGGLLYIIGFVGESLADAQLHGFKQHQKGVFRSGLWAYSRHPNYFFECLVWLGISIAFIGQPLWAISFIGPLSIFIIMYFITGPYTEKCSLERHGDVFKHYQSNTSYFIPWRKS
jgi:steroid 5-alpha reductase family enzyme